MSDHVILRCQGKETIRLADRLRKKDVEVWTPTYHRRQRLTRYHKMKLVEVAALPSYVFLRCGGLPDAIDHRGALACPMFGVMRHNGEMVTIFDHELDNLRRLSAEMDVADTRLEIGAQAIVTSGPMADYMVRVIGRVGAANVVTDLSKKFRFTISPALLKVA